MNNELSIELANNYPKEKIKISKQIKRINYLIIKRLFDIVFALIGLVLLIPVAIIIKILYIINKDFSSIFYTQTRIGKNGKEFKLYKFRTMVKDADNILDIILKDNKFREEWLKNKKLTNDPRVTKMGKTIRKYSIDELPQVINILKSEMTLIGNRPYLPKEKKDIGLKFNDIVKTKPGLTGYWQVSGRSNVSFKKRCELEQFYSNNHSLKMDIKIFFKTFKVIFLGRGSR